MFKPGSDSNAVFFLQYKHRFFAANFKGSDPGIIKVVHHYHMQRWALDLCWPFCRDARFLWCLSSWYDEHRLPFLVTALVDDGTKGTQFHLLVSDP